MGNTFLYHGKCGKQSKGSYFGPVILINSKKFKVPNWFFQRTDQNGIRLVKCQKPFSLADDMALSQVTRS